RFTQLNLSSSSDIIAVVSRSHRHLDLYRDCSRRPRLQTRETVPRGGQVPVSSTRREALDRARQGRSTRRHRPEDAAVDVAAARIARGGTTMSKGPAIHFPFDPAEFAGKRALVTGGTKGMGEAIVRRLAAGGATVATTARSPLPDGQAVGLFVQADISTRDGVDKVVREVLARLGGVDILVNNVG